MVHLKCAQIIDSIPENVHTNLGGRKAPGGDSMWVKVTESCPKNHHRNTKNVTVRASAIIKSGIVHPQCAQIIGSIPGKVHTNLGDRGVPRGDSMWVKVTDIWAITTTIETQEKVTVRAPVNSESGMVHPKCVQIIGSIMITEKVHTNLGGRGAPRVDSMWVKVTDICPKHHHKNTKKGDGASSSEQ